MIRLERSEWESSVINPSLNVYKLFGFANGTLPTARTEARKILQQIWADNIHWVSVDTQGMDTCDIHALEEIGFHFGTQYYEWEAQPADIVGRTLKFLGRYSMVKLAPEHADAVAEIASNATRTGRFVDDPYLPREWGKKLYYAWGHNLCTGYSDLGVACFVGDSLAGFIASKIRDDVAILDFIAVDSKYEGMGVGTGLYAELVLGMALRPGISVIRGRTEATNHRVNFIYRDRLGFRIVSSGLVLHWLGGNLPDQQA